MEKEEAEEELARAEPVLERASEALKNIKRENLVEIRSFAQPPTEVQGWFMPSVLSSRSCGMLLSQDSLIALVCGLI